VHLAPYARFIKRELRYSSPPALGGVDIYPPKEGPLSQSVGVNPPRTSCVNQFAFRPSLVVVAPKGVIYYSEENFSVFFPYVALW